MNSTDFGVAIIGYGGMGAWHVQRLEGLAGMRLCGVYDILPGQMDVAMKNGLNTYRDMSSLLEDPAVELVTIATPNDTHLPLVLAALDAGKNVVCEKPVALNSEELLQMIDRAKKVGRVFSVHQNRRWDEDFLTVKVLLDQNTLGHVFHIESRVHGWRGMPGGWRNKKRHGGGMLLDWGAHIIDQILWMLGEMPTSLYAHLQSVTGTEVDDGFQLLLHFGGQRTVLLEVGSSNFISMPRWYVLGENGSAVVRDWDCDGEIVMVTDWEKRAAAGLTKTMAPRTDETIKTYPLPKVESNIGDYYRNLRAAVREGAPLAVKPEEVLRVMRIIDAAFESARLGTAVSLENPPAVQAF